MSLKVYIGGKLYDKADAKISVYDHGLLYGDGVFEGIRSYSGRVFRLEQHVDRLYDSAQAIHLEIPMTRADDGPGGRRHPRGQQAHATPTSAWSSPEAPAAWASTRARRPTRRSSSSPTRSASIPAELYEHGLKIITAGDDAQPSRTRSTRGSSRSTT